MSNVTHYVGRQQLLAELGISKATIIRWTHERNFPSPLPNSGQVPIYDRQEVDAWLRASSQPNSK